VDYRREKLCEAAREYIKDPNSLSLASLELAASKFTITIMMRDNREEESDAK
jgi:hypothetical protein